MQKHTLCVTDTLTSQAEGNFHPLGTPFPNALDTEAFAGCR